MGCFAFKSKAKNQRAAASGARSPAPTSDGQKSKASSASTPTRSIQELSDERGAQRLRVFDLDELSSATNGFSRALKIGEGGFGSVYRAFFRSAGGGGGGRVVLAVKRLNQRSLQGHKQWLAEVQFLGVLEHPNLVRLVGYCAVDSETSKHRLLVYEFMPNKSLDDHLFNRAHPPLSWRLRLQIMIGAARGLDYLHEGLQEVQVIYRDFKAANVLLDADFKPKLSDFGLAREGPTEGKTHVSTAVVGTHGYAAPDYIETGHLTTKSDVWSFGVVLYEILTGRRSLERSRPAEEQKLLGWVRRHPPESQSFRSIMDPRLGGRYPAAAARQVARLADRCLVKNPKERPAMREVVEELERVLQMEPPTTTAADKDGDRRLPPAKR
ncbi:probable serine/threonine-protein kinase PBL19 [Oryza glaberrima]|uniref:Protein kinase domain-containing protein n=1 Tax=Oryza glaberrima TaxID=4538 RepID=I1Q598_ORYGL|nr:probable serine/threonine-protein kinase PBL19 [Oryza glaberrima]XP_052158376.1 probable serine/threonine-protein kinase PBL19 [Oryza glaberrima]XP_052158377.1 probable serine/threonine-protein kinase PBL19 [Oryza glaberrima]XP_052158378.1 probable serine/threonine-protein kinase PBL19 [Oryza glaberrima]XP_052158380.1 probable serine/threonine-protein kinase PBL19 [Oryza glaberrima]